MPQRRIHAARNGVTMRVANQTGCRCLLHRDDVVDVATGGLFCPDPYDVSDRWDAVRVELLRSPSPQRQRGRGTTLRTGNLISATPH